MKNLTWLYVIKEKMTMRSLAKCVKSVGYPYELDVTYSALLRFANNSSKERLNIVILECVCEVFDCEIGDILKK